MCINNQSAVQIVREKRAIIFFSTRLPYHFRQILTNYSKVVMMLGCVYHKEIFCRDKKAKKKE
jgi:hypothetical protein